MSFLSSLEMPVKLQENLLSMTVTANVKEVSADPCPLYN